MAGVLINMVSLNASAHLAGVVDVVKSTSTNVQVPHARTQEHVLMTLTATSVHVQGVLPVKIVKSTKMNALVSHVRIMASALIAMVMSVNVRKDGLVSIAQKTLMNAKVHHARIQGLV
jgi:hypothetical protein